MSNSDGIDYKDLLWKYMNHVCWEENLTHPPHVFEGLESCTKRFSPDELKALLEIKDMPDPFAGDDTLSRIEEGLRDILSTPVGSRLKDPRKTD